MATNIEDDGKVRDLLSNLEMLIKLYSEKVTNTLIGEKTLRIHGKCPAHICISHIWTKLEISVDF